MMDTRKARAEARWTQWRSAAAGPDSEVARITAAGTDARGAASSAPTRRASSLDYAELFEKAPVGDMLLDGSGRIEKINQTGATMLGWEAAWLVGKPFSRWVVNNDKQLFAAHQRELRGRAEYASQELRIKNRQGRPISLRLESTLIGGAAGDAVLTQYCSFK